MLLRVNNLTVCYGKAVAIDDVSLQIPEGAIVSLVGANGAGKTTLLRTLSGLNPPDGGEIWFGDTRIDGRPPADIVKCGLIHIPQNRELFPHLTVLSNLKLGASLRMDKEEIKRDIEMVFEHFPRLRERRSQKAGTLSGGEQ
jgi:branched-chain amino acid transport system ATP-binding protein